MKKLICFFLIIALFASTITVNAEDDGWFKPGDEYKDGIQYIEETVYQNNGNSIYYSDVNDYSAVGLLGSLKIMGGTEENLFKPNLIISRAEFLEGLLKLMRVDCSRPIQAEGGIFYDVDETDDRASMIYQGVNYGIVSGYDDNSFRPDNSISYLEAVIFAVRALGYGDVVNMQNSYEEIASRIELTKGVKINNRQALTRMDMAEILMKVLETPMCNMLFTAGGPSYTIDGETPLEYYWNIFAGKGIVYANNVASLSDTAPVADSILIEDKVFRTTERSNYNLLGYMVNYYYDEDDNLVYIHKNGKTSELTIDADAHPYYNNAQMGITYENGSGTRTAKLNPGYRILYNGLDITGSFSSDIFSIDAGCMRLISNSNSNSYDYIFIEEYRDYFIDSASLAENGKDIRFVIGSDMGTFTINSDDTYVEIYDENGAYFEVYKTTDKGEEKVDISALGKNSVLSIFTEYGSVTHNGVAYIPSENTRYIKIIVSMKKVDGIVESIDATEHTITINGVEYPVSKNSNFDFSMIKLRKNSSFYVNYEEKIAYEAETKTDWKYYYLVKPRFSWEDELESLQVFTSAGKMETYNVAEKYRLNGKRVKQNGTIKSKLTESAQMVNPSFEYQQLIKMKLNDDSEITEIETVTSSVGVDSNYEKDHLRRADVRKDYKIWTDGRGVLCDAQKSSFGAYFKPNVFFTVPNIELTERRFFSVVAVNTSNTVNLDLYDVEDLTPNVAVRYQSSSTDEAILTGYANSPSTVMLDWAKVGLNEDDEIVLKINVAQAGTTKEYYSYDLNILDGYRQGDLFKIFGYDTEITKVQPIMYNGEILGPDNLPPINSTDTVSIENFTSYTPCVMQVYKLLDDSDFIVQRGGLINGTQRQEQWTCCIRNKEWQMGGVLLYNEIDGETKAEVRQGTYSDLRSVLEYGISKASIVVFSGHEGSGRQVIIYNLQ